MRKPTMIALLVSVSPVALLVGSPANAADLARKAPPPMVAPAPAYSWTGCYVGAHVGWGWGHNRFSEGSFSTRGRTVVGQGGLDSSGALFGGQVGCNYQFGGWSPWSGSNWVIGVQGDFAGTDFNGKAHDTFDLTSQTDLISMKSDWLGSVTGRLGLTFWNNQALVYVKGGGAWIHNKWDVSQADLRFTAFNDGQNLFEETRSGWTIGGGVEWTLWSPNWTAFVEYNFYDFDSGGLNQSTCLSFCGGDFHQAFQTGRQEINTVKVGVNYKFWGSGGYWGNP
jgi:outer membrane immunogenic protein